MFLAHHRGNTQERSKLRKVSIKNALCRFGYKLLFPAFRPWQHTTWLENIGTHFAYFHENLADVLRNLIIKDTWGFPQDGKCNDGERSHWLLFDQRNIALTVGYLLH